MGFGKFLHKIHKHGNKFLHKVEKHGPKYLHKIDKGFHTTLRKTEHTLEKAGNHMQNISTMAEAPLMALSAVQPEFAPLLAANSAIAASGAIAHSSAKSVHAARGASGLALEHRIKNTHETAKHTIQKAKQSVKEHKQMLKSQPVL